MGFPSPMLLQAALILLVVSQGIEKICREDNKYCRPLPFTTGDDSKDAQCRRVCAKKRGFISSNARQWGELFTWLLQFDSDVHGKIFEDVFEEISTALLPQNSKENKPNSLIKFAVEYGILGSKAQMHIE
nr:unnamed protein product [Spirometra erinaceieuropaei]